MRIGDTCLTSRKFWLFVRLVNAEQIKQNALDWIAIVFFLPTHIISIEFRGFFVHLTTQLKYLVHWYSRRSKWERPMHHTP